MLNRLSWASLGWLQWQYHPKFAFYANPLPIFEGKSDSPHFIHDPNSNRAASPCWLLLAKLYITSFLNTGLIFWPPKWVVPLYLNFEKSSWKNQVGKKSSTNWIFSLQKSISKLIFAGYTGSKNLIFLKSSTDQQGGHILQLKAFSLI